jgi:ATP-binding cassette subfamily F protein 3
MSKEQVVMRFDNVTFKYEDKKEILDKVNFSIRRNSKITIMGQNGAGKSTIFKLMTGVLQPSEGQIHLENDAKIAIAEQMIPLDKLDLTLTDYFKTAFDRNVPDIERRISKVLEEVNLIIDTAKLVRDLSGGQKARLLLAYALIQEPDVLLLDEPTNNLDDEGIAFLTYFLILYPKTVVVISHDADFLNAFTDGVLNLDVHTKQVEQFVGNYFDVVEEIQRKVERARLDNARIEKSIQDRFEKINKLGGKSVAMRRLANKVRADIDNDRENIVEVRKEDRTIPEFVIPEQHCPGVVMHIEKVTILKEGVPTTKEVDLKLHRADRLLIKGPNGIGKSTMLKTFLEGKDVKFWDGVKIGYYSQDFSELDFESTAYDSLKEVMDEEDVQEIFGAAGRFMLSGSILQNKVGSLSEGQKGLLCYARFMLQKPGILIMDEPTNHINFRHIPVIAEALNNYKGVLVLVSHVADFVAKIKINNELDLTRL